MIFLQQLQEQLANIWQNLSKLQRVVVIGTSFLVAALLIFSAFFLGRTNYEPLYPNLNLNDSAMIAAKLKDMKTDYRIDKDGTTILVPSNLKYQLRLDLANQLPQGGVIGFESFNETRFGETDTDKRVRYLAALQNELTRTIQEMAEVDAAKVHIVLPEPSVFVSESKPATASVLLKLKPYSNMDTNKVKSIVYFLTHSVEGLSSENVTVIDVYGNLLSEGIQEANVLSTANLTVNQMVIKKQFEEDLSKSLQTMLEKVMGPGKAVVRASVEMDFDQVETSSEEFGDKVLRSEQVREESSEGTTNAGSGVPGTETNLTDMPSYQNSETGGSSSQSSEVIRNYEINKIVEVRKKSPGEIKKLSVAVILDGQLTTQEQENIQDVIARAAGINETRGDLISITSLAFNNESYNQLQEQLSAETSRQNIMEMVKYGVLGVGILAVFAIVFLLLRRSINKAILPQAPSQQMAVNLDELYNKQLTPVELEKIEVQRRIEKIAKTQPENVAKVIKTWLAEDSR
ncbi:MAG: flagellar basal-body MS-ring/collar protein FliF [Bacillota bacterium]